MGSSVEVVLLRGPMVEGLDVADWIGKPVMDQPGGKVQVGTVKEAWIDGDMVVAKLDVDDKFAQAFLWVP